MNLETLDTLVAAAQAGGDWAFGRLWEQLSPSVGRYVRARGVLDVDDVTSEVFLAAFRSIRAFDDDGTHFRSWLFTIAHHKAVDAMRVATSRPQQPYDAANDLRTTASAENAAMTSIEGSELARFMDQLTPDQRDVLLLRFIADMSTAQVSELLGKPPGAVKQLQRRGLSALRHHLDGAIVRTPISPNTQHPIAELR